MNYDLNYYTTLHTYIEILLYLQWKSFNTKLGTAIFFLVKRILYQTSYLKLHSILSELQYDFLKTNFQRFSLYFFFYITLNIESNWFLNPFPNNPNFRRLAPIIKSPFRDVTFVFIVFKPF